MVVSGLALWLGLLVSTLTTITLHVAQADLTSTGDPFLDWLIIGKGGQLVAALTATLFAIAGYLKIRTVAQKVPRLEQQVQTVQRQTNGTLSYKDNRIAVLESHLRENNIPIPPHQPREENSDAGNS